MPLPLNVYIFNIFVCSIFVGSAPSGRMNLNEDPSNSGKLKKLHFTNYSPEIKIFSSIFHLTACLNSIPSMRSRKFLENTPRTYRESGALWMCTLIYSSVQKTAWYYNYREIMPLLITWVVLWDFSFDSFAVYAAIFLVFFGYILLAALEKATRKQIGGPPAVLPLLN